MEYHPITQIIISLIILLLMGYVAYNIYLIELRHMFKGNNDIKKETEILRGIYDYGNNYELKFNTINKSHKYYIDISPSINQEGGAEYSYNFWLYVDQNRISKLIETSSNEKTEKDIVLFFKGDKHYYNSDTNYNCHNNWKNNNNNKYINLVTKNPLVRINRDGTSIAIDYNNILSPDSYQNNSTYQNCTYKTNTEKWENKNINMLGVYDITFNNKWFMVTIVFKEVADNNNILTKNRALCRIYINGMLIFENKVETVYEDKIRPATIKHNKSEFYVNPTFENIHPNLNPYLNWSSYKISSDDARDKLNILKIADLKYFNYAIEQNKINSIYREGFFKEKVIIDQKSIKDKQHYILSQYELEENEIKEL